MADILPRDLPAASSVIPTAAIISDDGTTVQRATPLQIVDAARPLASQAEAVAGAENSKIMTALRVTQAGAAVKSITDQFAFSAGPSPTPGVNHLYSDTRFSFGLVGDLQALWGDGFENNTRHFVGNTIGGAAVVGYTKTSLSGVPGNQGGYALGAFVEHDYNSFGYGQYTEIRRRAGAGAGHGQEIAIVNFGSTVDVDPYNQFATNLTDCLRLSVGRTDTPTNTDVSSYAGFYRVGAKARKGMIFGHDSLVMTSGKGDALNFATGHQLQWWSAADQRSAFIRSDVSTAALAHGLVFRNGVTAIQDSAGDDIFKVTPDGAFLADDMPLVSALSSANTYPYAINVYTEADDPTGTGPVASTARVVQSLGTHTKPRYGKHIQVISDGSGVAAGPANADFGAGVSIFRKNWQTNNDPGEIDGLGIVAINGVGDVCGLLYDVGTRDGFSACWEGASRIYLPDGSDTHKVRVQAGVCDSVNDDQYGWVAVKNNGVGGHAFYSGEDGGEWENLVYLTAASAVRFQVTRLGRGYLNGSEIVSDARSGVDIADANLVAFQSVVNAAVASGLSSVKLPAGSYTCTAPIIVPTLTQDFEIILHPNVRVTMHATSGCFIQASNCGGRVFKVTGGGRIDCSAQPVPAPADSFGIIEAQDYVGGLIEGITFDAGGDYRTPKSDSPIFIQGKGMVVNRCVFLGAFDDACVYDSADGVGVDGEGTRITNCYASKVKLFAISKRLARGMTVDGCRIVQAYQGVATGAATGTSGIVAPGLEVTISNTDMIDCAIPVRLSWANSSVISSSTRILGFGLDLDGVVASSGAAVSLRGCDRVICEATIRNGTANTSLHAILLTDETVDGVTRGTTNTTIKGELDGGVGGGRAIFEQSSADTNTSDVVFRGTWDTPIVQVGSNSYFWYASTTDRTKRLWRGGSDKLTIGGSIDFTPGSGSDMLRVRRHDSPTTSYMDQYTDSGGHRYTLYSQDSAAKKTIINTRTISGSAPSSGNCDTELQWNSVTKLTVTLTGFRAALPTYADDAAAGAGGLVTGDAYVTATGAARYKL